MLTIMFPTAVNGMCFLAERIFWSANTCCQDLPDDMERYPWTKVLNVSLNEAFSFLRFFQGCHFPDPGFGLAEVLAWKCSSIWDPLKACRIGWLANNDKLLFPLPFMKKAQVSLSVDVLPSVQLPDISVRDLFGIALKSSAVSCMFHLSSCTNPCLSSGSLSFQGLAVSS